MSTPGSQNRESYERVLGRLQMIFEVSNALTQSFDLEQTLDDILDKVLEVLGMGVGAVYLLDEDDQGLTLVAHRDLPPEVLACPDGRKSSRMLARHEALLCKLAGPLRSKGVINGLLFVGDRASCPILRQEQELLNTVCNTIGMFVDNVHLYQQHLRQSEIEKAVVQVANEVTSELELNKVLPKLMEIAVDLLKGDGGILALLNEEAGVITYPFLHHLPAELADVTISRGEGLSGETMTTGLPTIIDNYQTYHKRVPAFAEAGLRTVGSVPIVSGDRTFGALLVLYTQEGSFLSARDLGILTAIGRQAGIAIENSYLYENMRFYARQITQAQENERKRIARELHDDTIQSLIALSRRAEALGTQRDLSEPTLDRVKELQTAMGDVIKSVRRFSQDLRPSILDDLGLLPTLEELATDLNRFDGLCSEFQSRGVERRLSSEAELTLFRIAQEALNNVRKHADASHVMTSINISESHVMMTVQDDGKGFIPPTLADHPASASKLGLIGMYERASLLGGSLAIRSSPGEGTSLVVNVPA